MAVLIEAISVVIKVDSILRAFDDFEEFENIIPNKTLCSDNEIVRVGFMVPDDVEAFIDKLKEYDLIYLDSELSIDIAVVEQRHGLTTKCEWLEFGHINLSEDGQRIATARLVNSKEGDLFMPDGWQYENSLSSTYGFVPTEHVDKSLEYLKHENGVDVYLNSVTGKEVYIGRTGES